MAQVLAVVAGRVVPTAMHVSSLTIADSRRGAVGMIPDAGAALALDVVHDVGDELVAVRAGVDGETLALATTVARPPGDRVTARLTQLRDVDRPPRPA